MTASLCQIPRLIVGICVVVVITAIIGVQLTVRTRETPFCLVLMDSSFSPHTAFPVFHLLALRYRPWV